MQESVDDVLKCWFKVKLGLIQRSKMIFLDWVSYQHSPMIQYPSTIHISVISLETTEPNLMKLGQNILFFSLSKYCSNGSSLLHNQVTDSKRISSIEKSSKVFRLDLSNSVCSIAQLTSTKLVEIMALGLKFAPPMLKIEFFCENLSLL